MRGKALVIIFALVLAAGIIFIADLGRSVIAELDALSTARHDDISWNMSQLEIEVLNLDHAVHDAMHHHDEDLSDLRKSYDIYFSRVKTLTQSVLYDLISKDAGAQAGLAATNAFIETTTPIIDGPDDALRDALADLQIQIEDLRPQVRALSLAGIQVLAKESAGQRGEFSNTLVRLATSVIGLIVILLLALATLLKLRRAGQQVAQDNQVVRARFEAAISSSLDAVLVIDTNGTIVEFNGAAETVFGYSRTEALGSDMAELIVPEHLREMHNKGMARYLETGEQKVIGAGRVRLDGLRKSGEVFPVELSISLSEADGEKVFVSFLRDITRELEAEEELLAARDKAQEGEKAKTDLLTVMSHEMRTPLNGILGSVALLNQDNFTESQKRHLNSISVSGELLLSHVKDVLSLSSLGAESTPRARTKFDLLDVVEQIVDGLAAQAQERRNKLSVTCLSDDVETVVGSKRSLQQCLINLVGNALKFTSDGEVAVEIERLNGSDLVEIRISDNGVGIAPQNLDSIFEEFVTIDTAYARQNAGTGLGLAITKRLIETMEGEIEADSILGEGSLFTLRIPLPVERLESTENLEHVASTLENVPPGQQALVVDDNEINRIVLSEMLRKIGLSVDEATDGFEAINCISQKRFDILFLDISMPGIDGIETLNRIRKLEVSWRNLPAIAVTAHAAPKDHQAIRKAPFLDILVKPVRSQDIQAKLSSALTLDHMDGAALEFETAGNAFKAQFGEHKYHLAVKAFNSELTELLKELKELPASTDEIRQKAHKLAGSAAVLGAHKAYSHLQAIEHCSEDVWLDVKERQTQELCDLLASGK